ncbi:PREDICTED: basic leucine zipper 19-like [Camelina sativa]|uniref:Basic leucine zipper 19-like n=1 Tax=Camelina sativa TaxID=90675 RepID=A0ABM0XUT1_CAMSA|nr:PREDICTED: basic leucine zipper 19-like [Camelina sativa]
MSFHVVETSSGIPQSDNQVGEKKSVLVQYELEPGFTIHMRHNIDPATDPQKLKQIIANRVSAHKSRWKKLQYVKTLVKGSMELQMAVNVMRAKVKIAIEEKQRLENEKKQLKEAISARLQDYLNNDGITNMYKAEIQRLKKSMAPPTSST